MTVLVETSSRSFNGNDATTEFATLFRFIDSAHLTVTLTDASDVDTVQTEGVDYTVTGEDDADGGTITMVTAPATGETLTIERNTPILQEVDIRPTGQFLSEDIEGMFDKLTLIAQENRRRIEALEALGATLTDSATADITFVDKTFLSDATAVEDGFPLSVAVTGGSTATGAWAVRLRNLDDGAEVFDEPPAIQWAPGAGDTISLTHVAGLKPGTNYTLRLAVVIP